MELDNAYSGNVVDLCPVGALTSKDFRFKQRVWFLNTTKSVCTGCANGCAITLDHRDGNTYRYKPRFNPNVNDYWMCDAGRLSYKALNEHRLYAAIVGGAEQPIGMALDEVLAKVKTAVEQYGPEAVAIVGSAHATFETNYVVKRFASEVVKTPNVFGVTLTPGWDGDDFLMKPDRTPNRRGVEFLGLSQDEAALKALLSSGKVRVLIAVDNDLWTDGGSEWQTLLTSVPTVVLMTKQRTEWADKAAVVLPIATHVEQFGSFVQVKGVLQKLMKAYDADGDAVPAYEILGALARAMGTDFGYDDVEQIWTDLRGAYPEQLAGLTFYGIPETGYQLPVAEKVGV